MQPRDTKYLVLDDGRKLCLECLDSAIVDTNECQPLYIEIGEFYEGLNMKVQQQVPLLLVERQALNEAMEGEKQVKDHIVLMIQCCLRFLMIFLTFTFVAIRVIITCLRQEDSASQKNRLCAR